MQLVVEQQAWTRKHVLFIFAWGIDDGCIGGLGILDFGGAGGGDGVGGLLPRVAAVNQAAVAAGVRGGGGPGGAGTAK